MAVFISVLEGESPHSARPLLVTGDPRVVSVVARELARIFDVEQVPARIFPIRADAPDED